VIELGHFLPGGALADQQDKGMSETYTGLIEVGERRLNAYVKLLPDDRQLVNELLASVLAKRAGLNAPDAYLVLVSRQDYPTAQRFATRPGLLTAPAFATSTVNAKAFRRRADLQTPEAKKKFVSAWKEWPDVLGFDDWIANGDRNNGNYLAGQEGEVWLIDHGLALTGQNWSVGDLSDPKRAVQCRLWNELIRDSVEKEAKDGAAQRMHARIEAFRAVDLADSLAAAHLRYYLTPPELKAVREFLSARIASVASRVCAVLGIPELQLEPPA
jgi:hypothetical protein